MAGIKDLSILFLHKYGCKVKVGIKCRSEEAFGQMINTYQKPGILQWTVSTGQQCTVAKVSYRFVRIKCKKSIFDISFVRVFSHIQSKWFFFADRWYCFWKSASKMSS